MHTFIQGQRNQLAVAWRGLQKLPYKVRNTRLRCWCAGSWSLAWDHANFKVKMEKNDYGSTDYIGPGWSWGSGRIVLELWKDCCWMRRQLRLLGSWTPFKDVSGRRWSRSTGSNIFCSLQRATILVHVNIHEPLLSTDECLLSSHYMWHVCVRVCLYHFNAVAMWLLAYLISKTELYENVQTSTHSISWKKKSFESCLFMSEVSSLFSCSLLPFSILKHIRLLQLIQPATLRFMDFFPQKIWRLKPVGCVLLGAKDQCPENLSHGMSGRNVW